jgi:hypothetical protein
VSAADLAARWEDVAGQWCEEWALELPNCCALNVSTIYGSTGLEVELYNERGIVVERCDVRRDDPHTAMRVAEGMSRDRVWL